MSISKRVLLKNEYEAVEHIDLSMLDTEGLEKTNLKDTFGFGELSRANKQLDAVIKKKRYLSRIEGFLFNVRNLCLNTSFIKDYSDNRIKQLIKAIDDIREDVNYDLSETDEWILVLNKRMEKVI